MKYRIRALDEVLKLVTGDQLEDALVKAGVSKTHSKAKGVIKSWRSTRGHVSTDGERVIRNILERNDVHLVTRDFWSDEKWNEATEKYGIHGYGAQRVPA